MGDVTMNSVCEANYDTLEWLPENAPYVEIDPDKIKIIENPTEFYDKLLVRRLVSKLKLF